MLALEDAVSSDAFYRSAWLAGQSSLRRVASLEARVNYDKRRVLAVACPQCGSAADRPCRTAAGKITGSPHTQRKGAVYPSFARNKKGTPKARCTDVECVRCQHTIKTAPERAPYNEELKACATCLQIVWAANT